MKTSAALIFALFAMIVGCKDDDTARFTVDQAWMDATIADLEKSSGKEYFFIVRAEYEGNCVVFVNNCCPMCMTLITYYSCDGVELTDVDTSKLKNQTTIWTPKDFECLMM